MAKEIERKFLIKRELWQPQRPGVEIRQGYLSLDPERTVRVRTKGAKGYLTIKGKIRAYPVQSWNMKFPMRKPVKC